MNQISVFRDGDQFTAAQRMAKALCSSTLVPEIYRGEANIGNCLMALELSNRTGASVMAIMQNMTPIHGKPSFSSSFLIGSINTCGRFTPLRFRFQGTEGQDDWGCRAVATDKESGEELIGSLITIGMAKSEGWFQKNGSKWKTMPEQMLTYRAAAFWTRAYAPEVSLGMHTSDEVADMIDVTPRTLPKQVREEVPNAALIDIPADTAPAPTPTPTHEPAPAPAPDRHAKFIAWLESQSSTPERFVHVANLEGWFDHPVLAIPDLTDSDLDWISSHRKSIAAKLPSPIAE